LHGPELALRAGEHGVSVITAVAVAVADSVVVGLAVPVVVAVSVLDVPVAVDVAVRVSVGFTPVAVLLAVRVSGGLVLASTGTTLPPPPLSQPIRLARVKPARYRLRENRGVGGKRMRTSLV
jgi:hypothetical protein